MERVIGCRASFLREQTLKGIVKESASCIRAGARGDRIHKAIYIGELDHLSHSDRICADRLMYLEALMVNQHSFEGAQVVREVRYWYFQNEKKIFSAKPDAIHIIGKRGLVVNYKTGHYPFELLPGNWQMRCECAIIAWTYQLDEVVGALLHPNAKKDMGTDHHYYTFSGDVLREEYIHQMARASEEVKSPFLTPTPSWKSCEFCLAQKGGYCSDYLEFEKKNRRPRRYAARS